MTSAQTPLGVESTLPDHTQLPESDGTFVKNLQEHPQSLLLTDSIEPILQKLHPDGQYCIGKDSGIYWRMTEHQKEAQKPQIGFMCQMYRQLLMVKSAVLMYFGKNILHC